MTTRAFILIETAVGKCKEVAAALEKQPGVKSVDAVTGPYDIIVVVEANDLNAIGELITRTVHPLAGVCRTVTCLTVKLK